MANHGGSILVGAESNPQPTTGSQSPIEEGGGDSDSDSDRENGNEKEKEKEKEKENGRGVDSDIDTLGTWRGELGVALSEVGECLAQSDEFDLAATTLSQRIGALERGDRDPTTPENEVLLSGLRDALTSIEVEQNDTLPACSRCGYEPEIEVIERDRGEATDEPGSGKGEGEGTETLCLVCDEVVKESRRRELRGRFG